VARFSLRLRLREEYRPKQVVVSEISDAGKKTRQLNAGHRTSRLKAGSKRLYEIAMDTT
jgi:hypothetical protein